MQTFNYTPKGVCARQFSITHDNGVIIDIEIIGGCNGNLKGIISLLKGMKIEDVIKKFDGILCRSGGRNITSCPDQIAQALKQI